MSENLNSKELPPKYYLNYYHQLLLFIKVKYQGVINENELKFITSFENLSENAQSLFVRFLNRKGVFFRIPKLNYPEIENIKDALNELKSNNFISEVSQIHQPIFIDLLNIYTKSELIKISSYLNLSKTELKKLNKNDLLVALSQLIIYKDFVNYINEFGEVIFQNFGKETEMIRFLYFGSLYGDMSRFVVKDLGHLQFEDYDFEQMTPYFKSRKEAEDKYEVSKMRENFYLLKDLVTPEEFYNVFSKWAKEQSNLEEQALLSFERMVIKAARDLERSKLNTEALDLYSITDLPPSRERQVRLLQKENELDKAIFLCKTMIESPFTVKEEMFASDFLNKQNNKKHKKTVTSYLEKGETILIHERFKYNVEEGVLDYFKQNGKDGFFSENYIWLSLFGLLFWDLIFDQKEGGIHNPFQSSTADLYHPEFFKGKKRVINSKLKNLDNKEIFQNHIDKIYKEKSGITNHFVNWQDENLISYIKVFYENISITSIKATLLEMTKNLKEHRRGLPDLFIWDYNGNYSFIEVKSPNDTLSEQQVFWLKFFNSNNINADIIRVKWIKNV